MGGHEESSGAPAASIGESTTSTSSSIISTEIDSGDDDASGSRVVFRDAEAFEAKRQRLVADGKKNLQIISDFDFTMTKFWVNGKRGASCHMVIADSGLLSEEYHATTSALRAKYYPMEVDMSMPKEERENMMAEWVAKAHEPLTTDERGKRLMNHPPGSQWAMTIAGLSRSKIVAAVSSANLEFRPGQAKLFKWVEEEQVPLLIFSAGLGDVLEEAVKQRSEEPLPSTCTVISNRMQFDENGDLVGFTGQSFHVFNKHAASAIDSPYFSSDDVKARHNVLLLGDSLGDPNMSQGIGARETLKIGFLNDKVEERMEAYMQVYDAVILGDGGLDFALEILNQVATK